MFFWHVDDDSPPPLPPPQSSTGGAVSDNENTIREIPRLLGRRGLGEVSALEILLDSRLKEVVVVVVRGRRLGPRDFL